MTTETKFAKMIDEFEFYLRVDDHGKKANFKNDFESIRCVMMDEYGFGGEIAAKMLAQAYGNAMTTPEPRSSVNDPAVYATTAGYRVEVWAFDPIMS